MHLSVKVPIEYPIKAIHIKVNSTIQAAKVELLTIHQKWMFCGGQPIQLA